MSNCYLLVRRLKSREAELVLTQQQVTEYKEITNRMKEEQTALNKRANDEIQMVKEVNKTVTIKRSKKGEES